MEKLEKLDKYVITPNINFYGGFVYQGKDIDLCDDKDVDTDKDGKETASVHIRQIIQDDVLITDIESFYLTSEGKSVKQVEHQEIEIEKGKLLVYVQGRGFVIPEYKMETIDGAIQLYDILRGGSDDTSRDEEKCS